MPAEEIALLLEHYGIEDGSKGRAGPADPVKAVIRSFLAEIEAAPKVQANIVRTAEKLLPPAAGQEGKECKVCGRLLPSDLAMVRVVGEDNNALPLCQGCRRSILEKENPGEAMQRLKTALI